MLSTIALQGCATAPDGAAEPLQQAQNPGIAQTAPRATLPVVPTGPVNTMAAAVSAALAYDARVRAALSEADLAGVAVDIARAGWQPSLGGSVGYGTDAASDAVLTLSQPLYDWGQTKANVARAQAEQQAAAMTLAATLDSAALEAAQSYIALKRRGELVRAARDNLQANKRIATLARDRASGGVGDASEAELAAIHQAEAETALQDALGAQRNARSQFTARVGAAPHATLARAPELSLGGGDLTAAAKSAPAVVAASAKYDAATRAVEAERASQRPRLAAEAFVSAEDGFRSSDSGVGLRVVLPTYTGNSNQRRVQAAEIAADGARWSAEQALREVMQQVQDYQDNVPTLRRRLSGLEEQRDRSRTLRGLYEDKFMLGERSLSDLATVQDDIYRIERELIGARYAVLDLQYAAAGALGKLRQSVLPAR